jgi:hypothetical protein
LVVFEGKKNLTNLGHFFIKGSSCIGRREFVIGNSQYYKHFAKNQKFRGEKNIGPTNQ